MLKYFFKHYDPWVDRYVFYDDGSTDQTLTLLAEHPNVEVRTLERSNRDSYILAARQVHNDAWKESRGVADWVIITPADEHLYVPDMLGYLMECKKRGITAMPALGYQMISETLPAGNEKMIEMVTRGYPWNRMNKLSIFDPNKIAETHYQPGRHSALPTGEVVYPEKDILLNLHYKYLSFEHTSDRNRDLGKKLGSGDREYKWGHKYRWTEDELQKDWQLVEENSIENVLATRHNHHLEHSPLSQRWWWQNRIQSGKQSRKASIGVKSVFKKQIAWIGNLLYYLNHWHEYREIRTSGWFDERWYVEHNPDVVSTDISPILHYLRFGRIEGRAPDPNFPGSASQKIKLNKGPEARPPKLAQKQALFILGAAKAGTTTLFKLLNSFPEFDGTGGKEPRFFSMDYFYSKGFEWYEARYNQSPSRIQFEATPHYLYFPRVPERVHAYREYFNKDVKFIVLLRESVSRCYSAWNMLRSFHDYNPAQIVEKHYKFYNEDIRKSLTDLLLSREFPSFRESVLEDIEREKIGSDLLEPSFVRKGIYSRQISHWLEYFAMEDFLFLETRELHNQAQVIEQIQDFLNIRSTLKTGHLQKPIHSNARAYAHTREEDQTVFSMLRKYYRDYNEELFRLIGRRYDWNSEEIEL